MSGTKEQVITFLEKCEELKKCKFIMATSKIKDLLKCIVNSPDLYKLFENVTKDFNYPEQKAKCLITSDDGLNRSYVALPQTVGQRLAFIFCLLVEFDRDSLNFNNFLQTYFREDGSYFESYQAFCRVVISGLQDMIKLVFKACLQEDVSALISESVPASDSKKASLISSVLISINEEINFILKSGLAEEDKEGAVKILTELASAVRSGNEDLIDALIFGYNYFVLYNKCVSGGISDLIESIAEIEATL